VGPLEMSNKSESRSFWTTLPGILTGLAALLTAVGGLYATGVIGRSPAPTPTATATTAPTMSAAPTPSESHIGFRLVEVILRADPFDYSGVCPVKVTFSGRISVAGGSGNVSYRFLRSDNASAPVQALTFTGSGSQDVSTTWTLSGSYSGWQAIEVLDPEGRQSDKATFTITCS
jgi:hypothetical protein